MNDESNAADDEVYQASFSDAGTFNYAPQKIQVSRSSLKSVMKSKLDVYNILSKEGQFYLPPINECTMDFIKDILTGKKAVGCFL